MSQFAPADKVLADALNKVPGMRGAVVNRRSPGEGFAHSVTLRGVFTEDPRECVNDYLASVGLPPLVFGGMGEGSITHMFDSRGNDVDMEYDVEPWQPAQRTRRKQ